MPTKHGLSLLGFVALQSFCLLAPSGADAQTTPAETRPDVGRAAQTSEDGADANTPDEEDRRMRIGPFAVDADLAVSQGYVDNVFATRNDKVDDGLVVVTPEISVSTDGEALDLELFGSAEIGRYWDETDENYEDFVVGMDATYRLSQQNSIFGGISFGRDHEDRQSPDDVNGTEPTLFYDTQAFVGTANRFENVTVRLGGTFERLNFDDVNAVVGRINNDDRDRDLFTAGARLGYLVGQDYELFAQGVFDLREYDSSQDDNGFERDSDGFNAALGLRYRPGRNFDTEVSLGYLEQDYDDGSLETISSPDFGVRVQWRPQASTRFNAFLDRSVQETTLFGASGYLSTGVGVLLSQRLRRDLDVSFSTAYYESDYEGIARQDNTWDVGVGGRYYFVPNFFVGTNYRFLQRDSNDPDEDYDEHRVFVTLGAALTPAYDSMAQDSGPPIRASLEGLYGGIHGSLANLGTELEGPRGSGGSLTADFADHGFGGGLFAGYGVAVGSWQLSLEIDAELSDADWGHARSPGGRVFSVQKDVSYSAGPVVGYWLNDASMIYGRFGIAYTSFDTDYVEGGNRFDESDDVTGLRFGLGAETSLGRGFFTRLDYSYTSYQDYDVTVSGGRRDNFANNESLVRLGVGRRFSGGAVRSDKTSTDTEADLAGFYLGASAGHNALNSDLRGPRDAGSELDAAFGDEGVSGGVFAGYGVVWHRIYLGVEAEAELSNVAWDLERDPTGRTFGVDKKGGYGAAVRAGYVLPGGALAYGRAGVMRGKFEFDFMTSGGNFEDEDTLVGFRSGIGLELPVSSETFARAEYSYTDYEDKNLVTGSGTERFNNTESLFRAAVGWRF